MNAIDRKPGDPELPVDAAQDFGAIVGIATENLGPAGNKTATDVRFSAVTPRDENGNQKTDLHHD